MATPLLFLQVGDLMPALKQRMTDSNKNLVIQALQLLGKLAKAMGRPIAREARGVLGPAIKCLTDPKPMVGQVFLPLF
jgi:cytoskeleton-associated protein 5